MDAYKAKLVKALHHADVANMTLFELAHMGTNGTHVDLPYLIREARKNLSEVEGLLWDAQRTLDPVCPLCDMSDCGCDG